MKAWKDHTWSWDIDGLSLHYYTVVKWPPAFTSVGFGEDEYAQILKATLEMDGLIATALGDHGQVRSRRRRSRWSWTSGARGTRRCRAAPRASSCSRTACATRVLAALNLNIFARHADRVRMANIAQMINVLQAMILTDKEKMVLTPTYHVFKMYVPFQDATFVPVTFDAGTYTQGDITLPRVDAIAAKDDERQAVAGAHQPRSESARRHRREHRRHHARSRPAGETLTAPEGRQREHLRRAEHRRAEADLGEGSGRQAVAARWRRSR